MSEQREADDKVLQERRQTARSWLAVEMRTRDQDATRYQEFFTDFQSAVEFQAYSNALAGFPSERALDVGCGTGRNTDTISSKSIVGIDLSRQELLLARERFGDSVALLQASATHLPFRDGVFDKLLCAGVLQHIPGEDQRALVIQEMARVLTRPARLVLAAHSYSWIVSRMFEKERVEHELFWHRFTPRELEGLLGRYLAPCTVKVIGICHLPRWRVGNKLGKRGVWLDRLLSRVPGLKYLSGTILVAQVDRP
jgi:ubiquinone/menaquinone biosynthesis C-methylase UbiE